VRDRRPRNPVRVFSNAYYAARSEIVQQARN
jgi:hypothetical protein